MDNVPPPLPGVPTVGVLEPPTSKMDMFFISSGYRSIIFYAQCGSVMSLLTTDGSSMELVVGGRYKLGFLHLSHARPSSSGLGRLL
jgi:hypothetical protein